MSKNCNKKIKSQKEIAPLSVSDDLQSIGHLREDSVAQIQPQSNDASVVTPQSLSKTYRFESEIGHGSQGRIFRARRLFDQKEVVIKQLSINSIKSWKEYELFHREAEILQKLDLPGVAKFYDAIDCLEDDPPCSYIVQELIAGQSLQQMLNNGHRFTTNEVYDILIQTLKILSVLHTQEPPVIHRDIKPSNLMLTPTETGDYRVTIIDFGAVANPQVQGGGSTVAGTFGYMPPEQLMGNPVPASDIYAVAAVAVQLFSGKSPANLPVKDFNLIFEPEMQNSPHALVTTLRQMLDPKVENRLTDIAIIIHRMRELQSGHDTIALDDYSAYQNDYELKLENLDSIFTPGSIELWKELPESTPRMMPAVYKATIDSNDDKLKRIHKSMKIKDKIKKCSAVLEKIIQFLGMFLITFCIAFIIIYLISSISDYSIQPNTLKVIYSCFLSFLYAFFMTRERIKEQNETKDLPKPLPKDTLNDLSPEIEPLIKQGRKTIATIVDIQYKPVSDNHIRQKTNKYNQPLIICSPRPEFIISYRFNPPDDIREEDIIHTCITHDVPDNIMPGTPIPILYRIIRHGKNDTVISMPFPLPLFDLDTPSQIIDKSGSSVLYKKSYHSNI